MSGRDIRAELDPSSPDGQLFFQERLALFGKWFTLAAFAHYFIANLPTDLVLGYPFDWATEYFGAQERIELAITACAALLWWYVRRRRRSPRALRALDAGSLLAPMGLLALAVHDATAPRGGLADFAGVLLACSNLVVIRAIVVPSTARRTLVLSIVGWLPVIAATASAAESHHALSRGAANMALSTWMWALVSAGCAAIASHILFRLRFEVAEAQRLGQYTLGRRIGQGAMGVVYHGHHAMLRRPTAIKMLAPDRNAEADLRRFEQEVQHTASLTHPNTIAIYDFGRSREGSFYYAMELVDGPSLDEIVRRDGPLPAWRVVHILRQICGALGEAHAMGFIHRDIKPANVMLCERGGQLDTVKVLDFGLVRNLRADEAGDGTMSATALSAVGTPLYMAPEAFENPAGVDERSDLYAVGATAYFLLTGTTVFSGGSTVAICSKHLGEAPEPPSRRLGQPISDDLERLILRCLAKDPQERPRARELDALLAACVDAPGWNAERVTPWWQSLERPAAPTSSSSPGTLTIGPRS